MIWRCSWQDYRGWPRWHKQPHPAIQTEDFDTKEQAEAHAVLATQAGLCGVRINRGCAAATRATRAIARGRGVQSKLETDVMRFFMVEGDVVSARKGEKAAALPPRAIFCVNAHSHHTTWHKLSADEVYDRLAAARVRGEIVDGISAREYERALMAIDNHQEWQQRVLVARGHWAQLREPRKPRRSAATAAVLVSA